MIELERGIDLFYRQQEKRARAKTHAEACEGLVDAIRAFIVTVLREIRKPILKLCKLIDTLIEAFSERMK